ncbi:MAG: helix-hairpin-helix domain-containing protein, partial [Anaerotignum sp.]|nr:helix-hairpin-helix domain-containing protein [Anaerotignum sp.]
PAIYLSGIGEKRAADIIAYRDENGEFTHITDIMKVSGIGEKMYEEIKEQITVEE